MNHPLSFLQNLCILLGHRNMKNLSLGAHTSFLFLFFFLLLITSSTSLQVTTRCKCISLLSYLKKKTAIIQALFSNLYYSYVILILSLLIFFIIFTFCYIFQSVSTKRTAPNLEITVPSPPRYTVLHNCLYVQFLIRKYCTEKHNMHQRI